MKIHIDRSTVTIDDLILTIGAHSRIEVAGVRIKAGPDGRVTAVNTDPRRKVTITEGPKR